MAFIIPVTGAVGSAPLILHLLDGAQAGTTIGSIRSNGRKAKGGLRFQANEDGYQILVNANIGGDNGRRFGSGLGATDLSNSVYLIHFSGNAWNRININTKAGGGMKFKLLTGGGYNNLRSWDLGGRDTMVGQAVGRHLVSIDPNEIGSEPDIGTFNPANINQQAFTVNTQNGYSNDYCWHYMSHSTRIIKTKAGACGVFGSNASIKVMADACITEAWVIVETSPKSYNVYAPFKIGDGATPITNPDQGVTLSTPTPNKEGGDERLHWSNNSVPLFIDAFGETINFDGYTLNWGVPCVFDFDTNTGANWTWTNFNSSGSGNFTLGADHNIDGTISISAGSQLILNGGIVSGVINGNVLLLAETNLSDVTINGNLVINTGLNSSLVFDNVVVTGSILNDSVLNTLTIESINGSILTAGDAGTAISQTNIIKPRIFSFILNPSIVGYEWRIYTVNNFGSLQGAVEIAGQEVATVDNQLYTYSYSVDTIIAVQVIDDNYEEFVGYYNLTNLNQNVTINLNIEENI